MNRDRQSARIINPIVDGSLRYLALIKRKNAAIITNIVIKSRTPRCAVIIFCLGSV